jgi:(4-O-methyl)-D-glucuronate---lignin esterase
LFISAGTVGNGDGWVDARGSFEAAQAASPVYRLLGASGLVGKGYPAVGELRDGGRIAFRQHPDGHSNVPNWPAFLQFAARQWDLPN